MIKILVNGEPRNVIAVEPTCGAVVLVLDHPDHPGVACARHSMHPGAWSAVQSGTHAVLTGGNEYKLNKA